jgi:serine protease AprX
MLVFQLLKTIAFSWRARLSSIGGIFILLLAGVVLTTAPAGAEPRLPVGNEIVVWVKFTDRGPLEHAPAEVRRQAALLQISERSLERRLRRAGLTEPLDSDLPVYDGYVDELRARGLPVRAVSRWLNAASVIVDREQLDRITQLPFVSGTERVTRYRARRLDELLIEEQPVEPGQVAPGSAPSGGFPVSQTPGDPFFYGGSWAQHRTIDTDDLHGLGLTGSGILITVLDTGFRETHQAFDSLDVLARRDFIHGDEVVSNEPGQETEPPNSGLGQESHGTLSLSVIAGNWPGAHMGTAYQAQVALAKTEWVASEAAVEMDYWLMAAEWADSLGADVISSSLGYTTFDDPADSYTYADLDGRTTVVTLAAVEAARRGITVVTAQGNGGGSAWFRLIAPADGDSVCAVGAVDSFQVKSPFSSFGPTADGRIKPDICAMGTRVHLCSSTNDSTFVRFSGTSFSTPAAAGLVALLLEAHPEWGPAEVLESLRETASLHDTPDSLVGFGVARGLPALDWVPSAVSAPLPLVTAGLDFVGQHPQSGRPVRLQLTMGETPGLAHLEIYDVLGRKLTNLFEEQLAAGARRTVSWHGADAVGRQTAPGVYLARFTAPGIRVSRRLVWIP